MGLIFNGDKVIAIAEKEENVITAIFTVADDEPNKIIQWFVYPSKVYDCQITTSNDCDCHLIGERISSYSYNGVITWLLPEYQESFALKINNTEEKEKILQSILDLVSVNGESIYYCRVCDDYFCEDFTEQSPFVFYNDFMGEYEGIGASEHGDWGKYYAESVFELAKYLDVSTLDDIKIRLFMIDENILPEECLSGYYWIKSIIQDIEDNPIYTLLLLAQELTKTWLKTYFERDRG